MMLTNSVEAVAIVPEAAVILVAAFIMPVREFAMAALIMEVIDTGLSVLALVSSGPQLLEPALRITASSFCRS